MDCYSYILRNSNTKEIHTNVTSVENGLNITYHMMRLMFDVMANDKTVDNKHTRYTDNANIRYTKEDIRYFLMIIKCIMHYCIIMAEIIFICHEMIHSMVKCVFMTVLMSD